MTASAITVALDRARRNEPGAAELLWGLVYQDLERLAAARLARVLPGQTLHATAQVHEALATLAKDHARPVRVLDLRYFTGLSIEEIAELENVSARTIDRDFLFARTWLGRFLGGR